MSSSSCAAPLLNLSITYVSSVPNGNLNNSLSEFPFSDHANFGDFTLLFYRGRVRIVQGFKTHEMNCRPAYQRPFALPRMRCHRCRGLLKVPVNTPDRALKHTF